MNRTAGKLVSALVLAAAIGLVAAWLWKRTATPQQSGAAAFAGSPVESSANASPADDVGWPFVRGPNFDGHSAETGIVDGWPDSGPPVLWVRDLGQGYSGFVASGDRVYTQYQTLGGQYVACLDAQTGKAVWEYRYDWPFETTGLYPGPRSTPTLDSGRVYFAGPSGLVGCLDQKGRKLWSVNVTEKFAGEGTDFGYSCSPTVVDGKVILPVGGKGASLVALDARDGSTVWAAGDDSASYTPALPIALDGQRQVIGYMEHALVCQDLATGRLLWRMHISQGYDEHAAWPIYSEPYLWISGPFQSGSRLLKLTGGSEAGYETVWQSSLMSNDVASSVLVDGCLYGFDLREAQSKLHRPSRGTFRCLDFATGDERWSNGDPNVRRRVAPPSPAPRTIDGLASESEPIGHATVRVADGKLILFNDTGELILARVNPDRYEELARVSVLGGEICWTPPTLHRGRLYVRNHSRAACVYLGRQPLDSLPDATAPLTVADIPQHEFRDISLLLGVEPEYAFDVPDWTWLRDWYLVSLAGLGIATVVTLIARLLLRSRMGGTGGRRLFWSVAFVLGVIGTTPLSLWRNEFVFTWPLALFVSFQAAAYQIRFHSPLQSAPPRWWAQRLVVLFFLATCAAYYLICRRLSLVTEWVFLSGFAAAVPFTLLGLWLSRRPKFGGLGEWLATAMAFSAYYWVSVLLLLWTYDVAGT